MAKELEQGTRMTGKIRLQSLKTTLLNFQEQELPIAEVPSEVFRKFILQFTEVENISDKQWDDIFMRWRLVDFLLAEGALEVQDNMLVEVGTDKPEVEDPEERYRPSHYSQTVKRQDFCTMQNALNQ